MPEKTTVYHHSCALYYYLQHNPVIPDGPLFDSASTEADILAAIHLFVYRAAGKGRAS